MERREIMRIRMTQSYRVYRRGQVLPDVPDGMATDWIRRGIAVEDKQGDLIETAAIEHQAEKADATPRKRGRPRAVPQPDSHDAAGT
jgi:hypothetical protein